MNELGVFGIIHLAIVIYALLQIFGSSATTGNKILWVFIVAIFPVFGVIIWYLMGPGTPKK